uniref:Uncharacterized protein n=1 Tax=Marseillevirus LCMAC201 TaxID=2506605 RepID=A0A481YVY1_9VIRU|nr:MAG: hypothetical protein LCMAC201_00820 [Marseillevirus LCMAC201]
MCLLTIVDLPSETELPSDKVDTIATELGLERPRSFTVDSLQEVEQYLAGTPPDFEGVVITAETTQGVIRIKYKKDSYVALHHSVTGDPMNPRIHLPILLNGELTELLVYHKSSVTLRDMLQEKMRQIDLMFDRLWERWYEIKDIKEQKTFAQAVRETTHPLKSVLYQLRSGKISDLMEYRRSIAKNNKSLDVLQSVLEQTNSIPITKSSC